MYLCIYLIFAKKEEIKIYVNICVINIKKQAGKK